MVSILGDITVSLFASMGSPFEEVNKTGRMDCLERLPFCLFDFFYLCSVEKKRKKRMQKVGVIQEKAGNLETLVCMFIHYLAILHVEYNKEKSMWVCRDDLSQEKS